MLIGESVFDNHNAERGTKKGIETLFLWNFEKSSEKGMKTLAKREKV